MAKKFVFGSKEWMNLLHKTLVDVTQKAGEQAKDVDFSMCAVYTNAPSHLADKDGRIAWHFHIKNNKVNFGTGEVDADIKEIADYELSHQSSVIEYNSSNTKEAEERFNESMKSGKFKFEGDASKVPDFLRPLHNLLAKRTI